MLLTQSIPAIWVRTTDAAYNAPTGGASSLGFLTAKQQARLERIRQSRLLYRGGSSHRKYFLEERRSQFDFPPMLVGERTIVPYVSFNVFRLISNKFADLLFGQEPIFRVDDEIQQAKLATLVDQSSLHSLFYTSAVEASGEGEAMLEACVKNGKVYLRRVLADEVFPEGELGPDGQYDSYVRYELQDVGVTNAPIFIMLETRYLGGAIERQLWQLDREGRKQLALDLDVWTKKTGVPLVPSQKTGIDRNTITWIANDLDHDEAVSDYDGLIELQDELNSKQTQVARVITEHADPKLGLPSRMFDEQGNARASHKAFSFETKDEAPFYITWNGELQAAIADRSFTLNGTLILAEMSPGLLGLKEGAAPDAARKLRLEATNALSRAARKAMRWKPGIRRALSIAQDLENTLPGERYDRQPIGVEMRDGIPVDELDRANTISILRAAGVKSVDSAVEELYGGDKAAADKELARLKKESEMNAPTIHMGNGITAASEGAGGAGAGVPNEETTLPATTAAGGNKLAEAA